MKKLKAAQLRERYKLIETYHKKYLEPLGVHLPSLKNKSGYTQRALTLICLSEGYPDTKPVTKADLTKFIKRHNSKAGNDIQEGRQLGKQYGWYIITGTRGDANKEEVPRGSYKLVSLEQAYPRFRPDRRGQTVDDEFWTRLKESYGNRCACCGSKENEQHRYNPDITKTSLQKGHKNPNLPLTVDNIIPQCECCNRPDLNNWIYNDEGRVIGIAKASIIDRCDPEIKKEIYAKLYALFSGQNPTDV